MINLSFIFGIFDCHDPVCVFGSILQFLNDSLLFGSCGGNSTNLSKLFISKFIKAKELLKHGQGSSKIDIVTGNQVCLPY